MTILRCHLGKVRFEFDPFEIAGVSKRDITPDLRDQALDEIAAFVLESVLSDVGSLKSPVNGRAFKGLSKAYKERKVAEGGQPVPDLTLAGDMLDSLVCKRIGDRLVLTVEGKAQDLKADNHNHFGIYGEATLPDRKFIPNADEGEGFTPAITKGINRFIQDALLESGG